MPESQKFIISGIDTDCGKTIVSAMLCAALNADYWKPVQAGIESPTDRERVAALAEMDDDRLHPETFLLERSQSPHAAANAEGIEIRIEDLQIPTTSNSLIIEGAGGLMVPLNQTDLFIDLFAIWKLPVILVVKTYLGSINHSLLSAEALRHRHIPIAGIIFNEGGRPESEEVILRQTGIPFLGKIPQIENLNQGSLMEVFDKSIRNYLLL